ncbi:MAG: TlyA family RNA methyltransferase [Defluviitaleaceae bacterium]|nr:TlyA family RNA methyltransferase [Defluviitaleaceae bacterium]
MKRLDMLVCETLGVSREYAKELILAGKCTVSGKTVLRPGAKFPEDASISIDAEPPQFVSRGGMKLKKAIEVFNIDLQDAMCIDIGASTGGFTDCMLQHGASRVLAIENGAGQLHPKLTADPRVISQEGMDIRVLDAAKLPFVPQFAAADLSFISATLALPKVSEILPSGGGAVVLIKPQFEVGRGKADKKGVVKDLKYHIDAIQKVCGAAQDLGLMPQGLDFSPIRGQNGNREYLLFAAKGGEATAFDAEEVVRRAFREL